MLLNVVLIPIIVQMHFIEESLQTMIVTAYLWHYIMKNIWQRCDFANWHLSPKEAK